LHTIYFEECGNPNGKPVVFLHGGPGNSVMSYSEIFTKKLQSHFVVVQWDQRESGKTAELNHSNKPLSVSLMQNDAVEMIEYLRVRFSRDKIYLMGHSWGGFLGLSVALNHPELLMAYIAISPMVNQIESEHLSLNWMIDKARENNNLKALEELSMVSIPFQNADQLYYHRNWLAKFNNSKPPSKIFIQKWSKKWLALFNEASKVNFFSVAPEISCPIYFLVGRKDHQTNFKLTEDYFNMLKANKKQLFWFTDSGHNPTLTEPNKLQEIVINEILSKSNK
ncbi:MAG: alpha/beta hydrolase, partial [Bacteroidia bacterium]|nr:alpha/beta hydrolase [Bacteroidia bacterium]